MNILGIDIGGSGIKGALVDLDKGSLTTERLRIPTPQPATPVAVARTVAEIARHFNWSGPIGCGLPAVVQSGIAQTAANIDPAWIGTPVENLLSEATACPVTVINDADAAGIAEMRYGAGKGRQDTVLLVTVGTGLGTAIFRNGLLLPNTELGHIMLDGKVAEHYASASTKTRADLSYKEWTKRLDLYLKHLHALLWPDLFIIGGEISKEFDHFKPYLTVHADVLPAQLLNEAGIVGAAAAAEMAR